jgi:hypothetical protein
MFPSQLCPASAYQDRRILTYPGDCFFLPDCAGRRRRRQGSYLPGQILPRARSRNARRRGVGRIDQPASDHRGLGHQAGSRSIHHHPALGTVPETIYQILKEENIMITNTPNPTSPENTQPKKPVPRWHWVAVAALVVVAGCASEEPAGTLDSASISQAPAETTSSAYTTTPPLSPPSPLLQPPPSPPPLPPPPQKPKPPPPSPQKPKPPRAASQCDPNYSGACVPIASDVDCEGGSGNGPAYVRGPVTVVGEDIYGLDGKDNDGIGCES